MIPRSAAFWNIRKLTIRPPTANRSLTTKHKLHTMTRTDTSSRYDFMISNEGGVKFPVPLDSSLAVTTAGSKHTPGLHWHETHIELLPVSQGAARRQMEQ